MGQPRLSRVLLRGLLLLLGIALLGPLPGCAGGSGPGVHTVRKGDTLYQIGRRYGVSAEAIRRENGIRNVRTLEIGSQLRIPSAVSKRSGRGAKRPAPEASPPRRSRGPGFAWPLHGKLTSRYGPRNGRAHDGIDIAAPSGTSIVAAAAGKVIHAGRIGDYGRTVIIKHEGSYRSVYAHARTLHVREGEMVERGERIAEVGRSGNASGPHLHFEIRHGERPRDPMAYLPGVP